MQRDVKHLEILGITHYVLAGVLLAVACWPLVVLAMALSLSVGLGAIIAGVCAVAAAFVLAMAGLAFAVGRGLRQHRRWGLSLAGSIIYVILGTLGLMRTWDYAFGLMQSELFWVPAIFVFALVLGVYTLVVIGSPGARALHFEEDLLEDRGADRTRRRFARDWDDRALARWAEHDRDDDRLCDHGASRA